ncbi:UdgX family uracil-DNA binding protein [Hydrogenophaga sp.]|uniref:UdgX family uracil-DNA binding protein n=1 Tax=Hydrogenophaga sp. TaxID=1904254 RepID=UPI002722C4E5|nr:UdgX family uracil-DNA binding protein [Hydrogenophaga sp.]MDO9434439.1 UdgX family uracil-DNA binding protein [Hydrogenophaga sp.]
MRWLIEIHPNDVPRSLRALSSLLACSAVPGEVDWRDPAGAQGDLLGDSVSQGNAPPQEARPLRAVQGLPTGFVPLAETVLMHADAERFRRLHAFALDLAADPRRWRDALDPRRLWLERAAREVRREIHKMHAFVRFRPIGEGEATRHVAWFEPVHHIVRAAAPFFAGRFASMHWAILTPELCVHWDREALDFTPGVDRSQAPPPDAGEALWIDYYRSIFNPSRVKIDAMLREMPRRYWRNLPEAQAITHMLQEAPERSARMVAQASESQRRLPIRAALPTPRAPRSAQEQLDDFGRRARHCTDCPMSSAATQMVWGEGAVGARLMIVGEQPGDQEDLAGRPFVGPAGQLLRQAIAALGWPPDALYLTNAVKHFHFLPRGKRRLHKTPGQREAEACLQWLEAEIRLVSPQAVLALGGTAASSVLGRAVSVVQSAGQWWWRDDGLPVWVVHHPAAVLRRDVSGAPGFDEWVAAMQPALPMETEAPLSALDARAAP